MSSGQPDMWNACTTNSTPPTVESLAALQAQLERIRKEAGVPATLRPREIWTHPNNREYLAEIERAGMSVRYHDYLPERSTRTVWHPPADERFVAFGPEDEAYMRPLGLGRLETVDQGPAIYEVDVGALSSPMLSSPLKWQWQWPIIVAPSLEMPSLLDLQMGRERYAPVIPHRGLIMSRPS